MTMTKKNVLITSNIVILGLFLVSATINTATAQTWEKLVDYGMEGYSETTQNWDTYTYGPSPGGSYRYLSRLQGDGSRTGTATWQTEIPYCGLYTVRVSCRKTENRTSDADYYVTNSNKELNHFVINQLSHRNVLDWDPLGTYYYEKGQVVKVLLDGRDDGASDCADATLWKLVKKQPCLSISALGSTGAAVAAPNALLLNNRR